MLKPDFTFMHVATLRRWLKQGMTGPEYAPPEPIRGRFDFARQKTQGAAAQEVTAKGTFFCTSGTRMEPESLIEFEGQTYSVLSCRACYDFKGENHVEVDLL